MRRAGRIIYNGAMVVSLLLCLATVGVWVRSAWVQDRLVWYDWPEDRSFFDMKFIWCSRGGVKFDAWHYFSHEIHSPHDAHFLHDREPAREYAAYGDNLSQSFSPMPRRYAAVGFEWIPQTTGRSYGTSRDDSVIKSLTLPLYSPALFFALLPAHYLLRVRRRRRNARRLARGCCAGCGYDLRGSPGRCPECGLAGPCAPASA